MPCKLNGSSELRGSAEGARAAGFGLVLTGGCELGRAMGSHERDVAALERGRGRGRGTRVTGRSPAGIASGAASLGTGGGGGAIRATGFAATGSTCGVGEADGDSLPPAALD